jgi:hypothetical protein
MFLHAADDVQLFGGLKREISRYSFMSSYSNNPRLSSCISFQVTRMLDSDHVFPAQFLSKPERM